MRKYITAAALAAGLLAIPACGGGSGGATGSSTVPASICDTLAASPASLFTAEGIVRSLAASGKLFVMNQTTGLVAVPGCGGTPEVVDERGFGAVVAVEGTLYWTSAETTGNVLKKRAASGGTATTVATSELLLADLLAVDGGKAALVVTDKSSQQHQISVASVDLATGAVTTHLTATDQARGLALRDGTIYVTLSDEVAFTSKLLAIPIAGGAQVTLASGTGTYGQIAVGDGVVIFARANAGEADPNDVVSVPFEGGDVATLASDPESPLGLVIDDDHVYWTNTAYEIRRAPLGGDGATTKVAAHSDSVLGLIVDQANLFWSDVNGGVWRVSKPE
jgi:hypothetical protein